jgi:hypothetical protein
MFVFIDLLQSGFDKKNWILMPPIGEVKRLSIAYELGCEVGKTLRS